jgi:hypothetical protein
MRRGSTAFSAVFARAYTSKRLSSFSTAYSAETAFTYTSKRLFLFSAAYAAVHFPFYCRASAL